MDKVRCPWCGTGMVLRDWHDVFFGKGNFFECVCGAKTPIKASPDTTRAAAMQRWQEPSRVLTLEEVRDRGGCPVWCEDRDGSGVWALVDNGEDKCFDADYGDWEFYCYGWTNERGWRAWTKKPSKRALAANPWPKED